MGNQADPGTIPVIANSMGFSTKMVFQTERSEQRRTITMEQLGRMARAMECDLVYGLVPWHRSLEDRAMELVEQELWRKRYTGIKGIRGGSKSASQQVN